MVKCHSSSGPKKARSCAPPHTHYPQVAIMAFKFLWHLHLYNQLKRGQFYEWMEREKKKKAKLIELEKLLQFEKENNICFDLFGWGMVFIIL